MKPKVSKSPISWRNRGFEPHERVKINKIASNRRGD
jgi:hypothetical protein